MICKHNIPHEYSCMDCMRENPKEFADRKVKEFFPNGLIVSDDISIDLPTYQAEIIRNKVLDGFRALHNSYDKNTIEGECTEVKEVKLLEGNSAK